MSINDCLHKLGDMFASQALLAGTVTSRVAGVLANLIQQNVPLTISAKRRALMALGSDSVLYRCKFAEVA